MNSAPTDSTGAARGSLISYATGFGLSIILTAMAFSLVIVGSDLPRPAILLGIFAAAGGQMLVHLHFFLHLNRSSAARWNVLALLATLLVMALFIGLTLWIMSNLNYRMM